MLGLAVGIDYALFIVSRYRQDQPSPGGAGAARAMQTFKSNERMSEAI
ncbi:MMPL family transporter [Streptosporangium sp. NPDC006013]